MKRLLCLVAVLFAFMLSSVASAEAERKTSPLGMPLPPSATQGVGTTEARSQPGVMAQAWNWLLIEQQRYNRELAQSVKAIKGGDLLHGTLLLAFLSFGYGVLHAAGPGHGKAIISSYVLANEQTMLRGVMLSFLSALIQALSAIVVVGILAVVLNATSMAIRSTEAWIESASWALVACVGLWLLYGQVRRIWARHVARAGAPAHAGHNLRHHKVLMPEGREQHASHDHVHKTGDECGCGVAKHHHSAEHVHDENCGHSHLPGPEALEGELSWRKALAIAFSVGIRPCSGAILVLIFALSQGIFIAGIFSAFAMALGTAITVSALAILAVTSREVALRLAGGQSEWAAVVSNGAGLLGSALVFILGASFFAASLSGTGPL